MHLVANIDVDDLEKGIEFYERALGLRLERRLFDNTVAEMRGASGQIYLLEKPAGSRPCVDRPILRDYQRHWTPVHLDFVVSDLEASVARAVAAGARLEGEPQSFRWGRLATMSDPFGHGICLVEWIGAGYDEIVTDPTELA